MCRLGSWGWNMASLGRDRIHVEWRLLTNGSGSVLDALLVLLCLVSSTRLSLTTVCSPSCVQGRGEQRDGSPSQRQWKGNRQLTPPRPWHCLADNPMQPVIDYDLSRRYTDTWQAMEKLVDSGKARSIGRRTNPRKAATYSDRASRSFQLQHPQDRTDPQGRLHHSCRQPS